MGVAVFIMAHEDDETLSMGPAIVNHYNAGHKIYTLMCSDGGNSGVWPANFSYLSRDAFCQARYSEYVKAAAALGVYSQCAINTSCTNSGYMGMLKDSTLNLGASYNADSNGMTKSCTSPGYDGNNLGTYYGNVNTDLYNAIKASLQAIANQQGISTQQLLVKTHSHLDVHEDHRAVCQAVLRLYREGFISDLRHYVSPVQWDSSFTYLGKTYPSASQLGASMEAPSKNLYMIDNAMTHYLNTQQSINGIVGVDPFGIGYYSVQGLFQTMDSRKCSYYHLPPSTY